jgi:predicted CXXCH cytochrome family protein
MSSARHPERAITALAGALAGLLLVLVAPAPLAAAPAYVGSEACRGCHAEAYALWQDSHHGWALRPASEASVLGEFDDAVVEIEGVRTRFFRRDGRFYVETADVEGPPVELEVTHTIGVTPLQQYLVEPELGRPRALSLAWDARPAAEGGQRWFHLLPGEPIRPGDPLHWTRMFYDWNTSCAACHETGLRKGYDPTADRFAATAAERTVGCEACHGPGSAHVAWARDGVAAANLGLTVPLPVPAGGRWALDDGAAIARWEGPPRPRPELDVCSPCHSRRRPLADGTTPGEPFLDAALPALLEADLYFPDGQIREEVYVWGSFAQSRMHAAGVTCGDCHEPHGLTLRAEGNALCGQCHAPAVFDVAAHHHHPPGSAGAACVACHMPARTYMVVDPRRDHSFRVPRPDLAIELGTPDACTGCHVGSTPAWALDALRRWYPGGRQTRAHFGRALEAGRGGGAGAEALLRGLALDRTQPAIARATAMTLLPRHLSRGSLDAYPATLADPEPLVRIGALRALEPFAPQQRLAAALPLLRDPLRAVRVEAARALADAPVDRLAAEDRAAFDRALAELVAAEEANAERPDARLNLGLIHARRGEAHAAEADYRRALRLEPSFTPAAVNLADLYRALGRDDEAETVLRDAIARVPGDAAAHHALGLVLVRARRMDEAVGELARAAALAPGDPRYAYVHAVALSSTGRRDAAIAALMRARARNPRDRDILVALVTLNRDGGNLAEARRYAELLAAAYPDDPGARQLLEQLRLPGRP